MLSGGWKCSNNVGIIQAHEDTQQKDAKQEIIEDIPETRIIIEETQDNYGHKKLIWTSDTITFPDRSKHVENEGVEYFDKKQYFDKGQYIDELFEKNELKPMDTTDFFKLYRYGMILYALQMPTMDQH